MEELLQQRYQPAISLLFNWHVMQTKIRCTAEVPGIHPVLLHPLLCFYLNFFFNMQIFWGSLQLNSYYNKILPNHRQKRKLFCVSLSTAVLPDLP